jgi:hypothetical protein
MIYEDAGTYQSRGSSKIVDYDTAVKGSPSVKYKGGVHCDIQRVNHVSITTKDKSDYVNSRGSYKGFKMFRQESSIRIKTAIHGERKAGITIP